MEITEEQKKRIVQAWHTIGLILLKHRDQFDANEWALICRASYEFYEFMEADSAENWPDSERERWRALE